MVPPTSFLSSDLWKLPETLGETVAGASVACGSRFSSEGLVWKGYGTIAMQRNTGRCNSSIEDENVSGIHLSGRLRPQVPSVVSTNDYSKEYRTFNHAWDHLPHDLHDYPSSDTTSHCLSTLVYLV